MALSDGRARKKYVSGNSDKISGASNQSRIIKNKSNTSTQLIQQLTLCLQMRYRSIYGSYLLFKGLKRYLTVPLLCQKTAREKVGLRFGTKISTQVQKYNYHRGTPVIKIMARNIYSLVLKVQDWVDKQLQVFIIGTA